MLITLVKEVNQSISDFLFLGNRKVNLPMTIAVKPNQGQMIRSLETGKLFSVETAPKLKTAARQIGRGSISFMVPQIRFNDANLAGEGRILSIELELPNAQVKFEAIGEHYERFGQRTSLAQYLIGAKIVYINSREEEIYRNYLRYGENVGKANNKSFVLGIPER